ncbi:MAG: TIGR00730 family Rossman fold protein [Actinomycetota bacterium]|nr:TIGR00730 family Rossman fold protein [Actinomycetota bacterium]
MKRICVYAGANPGNDDHYRTAAQNLANLLVRRGIGIVYGGGNVGLMGELADTVLAAGGEVVGIMPRQLVEKEVAHLGLTDLHVVESMHERKAAMADLSDAFVALPGGIGTLEEIIEVYTWSQLGLHQKACALLNINGYYDGLTAFLDHAVAEGFLAESHRGLLVVVERPEELIEHLEGWDPPHLDKVLDPEST